MAVHVLAFVVDLRVPEPHSLKEKRAVIKTIIEGARRRFQVAAAETDEQDNWNRAELSFSVVSPTAGHAQEVVDAVERFVWSFPEIEVLGTERLWLDTTDR